MVAREIPEGTSLHLSDLFRRGRDGSGADA